MLIENYASFVIASKLSGFQWHILAFEVILVMYKDQGTFFSHSVVYHNTG